MITEDYVSFETAKLLKEKRFDGPCYKVWESYDDSQTLVGAPWFVEGETVVNRELVDAAAKQYAHEYDLNNKVDGYLAPTLQMAMKWLKEVHNLAITTFVTVDGWCSGVSQIKMNSDGFIVDVIDGIDDGDIPNCDAYQEACEAAIKYCLENLI